MATSRSNVVGTMLARSPRAGSTSRPRRRGPITSFDELIVHRIDAFETKTLGCIAAVWSGDKLYRLVFGHDTIDDALGQLPLAQWDVAPQYSANNGFVERMQAYAAGRRDDFRDIAIVEDGLSPFARRVVQECRRIDYGTTVSYGELAIQAGSAKAARAVGAVMARNRVPLVVPCHRVIGANGSLHGFSARGGLATKQQLLMLEGGE